METTKDFQDMSSRSAFSKMNYRPMRRIFVFQIPTRLFHWINVLAIFTLAITGYIIGNPPALLQETEASYNYWFGINRFIHFVGGYCFMAIWLFRVIWSFIGSNRWENWRNFIPIKKSQWVEIWEIIKLDIFMLKNESHLSIGHNALAGLTYFIIFLVSLLTMFTGFALYAPMSESWFPDLFSWIIPLLGGDGNVRFLHHALMWIFVIFTMVHVYLVFYHDYIEGRGELSSILGGWKFIEEDCLEKNEKTEKEEDVN